MYQKTTLKNNLTLITHQMSSSYSVSIGVWLKIGSRYEIAANSGISHFLEHMVFKGSKKYDGNSIKRQIEGRGGLLNGFTSEELTCYLAKVPSKFTHLTFKILLDMALSPRLKQEDIDKERTVIIEEIKMYNDLPQHMVQDLLDKTMWPDHALGRNIAGTTESVNSITREDIDKFKDRYYQPENMVVVFAGNIEHKDCLSFIEDEIGNRKNLKQDHSFDKFTDKQEESKIESLVKEIEQTHLAIGFKAYKRSDPRRIILTILSIILGGNMSSRLFDEIREKRGLAYAISSQYKRLLDTGAFYIHAGLDNKKVDLAIELILGELSKLKQSLVPEAELTRAKEFCLGQLAMGLEDTMDHMIFLGEAASTTGKLENFEQIKKEIARVSPQAIKEVARDIFKKEKINISLVGPIKEFNHSQCFEYIKEHL